MPIPDGPRVVDLAFRAGVPSFAEVVDGLPAELVVEGATAAEELRGRNRALLEAHFPGLSLVPHERLKDLSTSARLVVRMGEARPYANVLPRCGVFFQAPSGMFRGGGPGPSTWAAPSAFPSVPEPRESPPGPLPGSDDRYDTRIARRVARVRKIFSGRRRTIPSAPKAAERLGGRPAAQGQPRRVP